MPTEDKITDLAEGLCGARVLIVEDEPFIALNIAFGVEQAGGIVLGPAMTIAEALELIETAQVDCAIVDVDLPDGTIAPVLNRLCPSVPVVVHTGVGLPAPLREAYPDLTVFSKPTSPSVLTRSVQALR